MRLGLFEGFTGAGVSLWARAATSAMRSAVLVLSFMLATAAGASKAAADTYSVYGIGASISYSGNGLPSVTLNGQDNIEGLQEFSILNTSAFNKNYQFNWNYTTSDASGKPIYDPASAYIGYTDLPLINASGNASQSGSNTVVVPAGQTLRFYLASDAADGTATLAVTLLSVTGFVDLTVDSPLVVLSRNVAASLQPVRASETSAPSFSVTPALPVGLSLDASSGLISGTPSANSPRATYTMTVSDGGSIGSATFQLEVNSDIVLTAVSVVFSTNTAGSATPVTAVGGSGALTYSVAPALPSGLTLASSTGVISGTATAVMAATSYSMSVTDGVTSASAPFSLQVMSSSARSVSPTAITGRAGEPLQVKFTPSYLFYESGASIRTSANVPISITPSPWTTDTFKWQNPIAGEYVLTVSFEDASANRYDFNIPMSIVSQAVAQTISFTSAAPAAVAGGATYTPTATATSSLSVALSIDATSAQVCSIASGVVSFRLPGSCIVNADQAGNDSYTAATRVQQLVTVAAGTGGTTAQTVSFTSTAPNATAGGNSYTPTFFVSSGLPATIRAESSSKAVCWVDGANVVFFTAGSCVINAEQAGNATYAAASPVQQTITVAAAVAATQAVASTTLALNTPATSFTPVTASGGASPLVYALSAALPAGLTFSTSTGAISGTPTALSAAANYTVTITDPNGSTASASFSLQVSDGPAASVAIASKSVTVSVSATPFTPVTGSGGTGALAFTIAPALPTGLTMASATGAISGTPGAIAASATYTVTVTDAGNRTATASFTLAVNGPVAATQQVAARILTVNVAAVAFTPVSGGAGASPLAYAVAPALPAGLSLSTSTGQITGTPTAASGLATYTVTVTDANSGSATATFTLTVSGAVTATQAVATKGLTAQATATAFTPVTGAGGSGALSYGVSPALPSGLSLAPATGAITGTPAAASDAAVFTITATDVNGASATATFTLTVSPALVATQAVAAKIASANVALTPFTPVTSAGGATPLVYSIAPTLPAGLSLASATGAISGTPTTASTAAPYTITVTDANAATATAIVTLTVNGPVTATQAIASQTLALNTLATPFTPVVGAGGTGALSYSLAPALPAGLVLSSATGVVSGTPTAISAAAAYVVTVTDSNNMTATASFSLTVGTIPTTVTLTASSTSPTLGQQITLTATMTPALATGTITFKDGSTILGSPVALAGGVATYTTSTLAIGAHSLTASYSGSPAYAASVSSVVVVTPARPNPANDRTVAALLSAQTASARQAAQSAITSVGSRLESLHDDNTPFFSNGVSVSSAPQLPTNAQAYGALTDPWRRSEAVRSIDRSLASKQRAASASDAEANRMPFNIWTSGSLIFGRSSSIDSASKFKFNMSGMSAGLDASILPQVKAGFSVGFSADTTSIGEQGSKNVAQTMTGSLYASWRVWDRFFIDGMAGYGNAHSTTTRFDANAGDFLAGKRPGNMLFGAVTLSYDETFGALKVSPYARYEAFRAVLSGYAETGAAEWALSFAETSLMSQGATLGLRAQYGFEMGWGTLSPKVRLEHTRTSDAAFSQSIAYVADPSSAFATQSKGNQRSMTSIGLGLQATTKAGTSSSLDYLRSSSSTGVQSQGMRGSVNLPF